jgi:4-cresol dehydrogenase (hydroxylating)
MTQLANRPSVDQQWVEVLRTVVGSDRVVAGDRAQQLVSATASMSPSRPVPVLVRPETAAQVAHILALASGAEGVPPVHAFSTGRSWGMGSRLPAVGAVTALDLSDLRLIRDLDTERGFAVIEPGVSQAELALALVDTDRMLNVTVSSAHTSVVGNLLDRGVGLRHQRTEDVLGLEVALPGGDVVRVGWWPDQGRAAVYRHGLGPDLLPAFVQSNAGVVTAAVVKLLPRPEASRLVQLGVPARHLEPAMEEVRRWVTQGMTSAVVKVYNPAAAVPYGAQTDSFLVHVMLDGTAAYVEAVREVLVRQAAECGWFDDIDLAWNAHRTLDQRDMDERVQAAYLGDPDVSDKLFTAKMGVRADQVDSSVGFLMFLPLIPFRGSDIRNVSDLIDQVGRAQCGVTFNALDGEVVDCVVTVRFERTDHARQVAYEVLDELVTALAARGYLPYRLGIDQAEDFTTLVDPRTQELVEKVRKALDPTGVIAPGRYAARRATS